MKREPLNHVNVFTRFQSNRTYQMTVADNKDIQVSKTPFHDPAVQRALVRSKHIFDSFVVGIIERVWRRLDASTLVDMLSCRKKEDEQ